MRLFDNDCELRLTKADIISMLENSINSEILKMSLDKKHITKLTLHPDNKYVARLTLNSKSTGCD